MLYTLVDSAIVVYRKYVGDLDDDGQAAFWEDYRVVGRAVRAAQGRHAAQHRRAARVRRRTCWSGDDSAWSATGRARGRATIVLDPPVPLAARPLVEAVNFITVALLPERIRREYGFLPLPPAWMRRALVAGGAEYVKRAVIPFLPPQLRFVPAGAGGVGGGL